MHPRQFQTAVVAMPVADIVGEVAVEAEGEGEGDEAEVTVVSG